MVYSKAATNHPYFDCIYKPLMIILGMVDYCFTIWLVVWNSFPYTLELSSQLTFIFFRWVFQPPTRRLLDNLKVGTDKSNYRLGIVNNFHWTDGSFPKWGNPKIDCLYIEEKNQNGWFGGTTILGNFHMELEIVKTCGWLILFTVDSG